MLHPILKSKFEFMVFQNSKFSDFRAIMRLTFVDALTGTVVTCETFETLATGFTHFRALLIFAVTSVFRITTVSFTAGTAT